MDQFVPAFSKFFYTNHQRMKFAVRGAIAEAMDLREAGEDHIKRARFRSELEFSRQSRNVLRITVTKLND